MITYFIILAVLWVTEYNCLNTMQELIIMLILLLFTFALGTFFIKLEFKENIISKNTMIIAI